MDPTGGDIMKDRIGITIVASLAFSSQTSFYCLKHDIENQWRFLNEGFCSDNFINL